MRIIPNIWCDGTALEAAEFYAGVFRDAAVTKIVTYPEDGLPGVQAHMAGRPLTVDIDVHGRPLTLINAGPEFTPNHSISFLLNFDPAAFPVGRADGGEAGLAKQTDLAHAYLDQVHDALIDGGEALMELGEYPHSKRYAWIRDRYGVTWQLMLTNPEGEPRPFLTPSFMFGGANQDRAREATDFWICVVADSARGNLVEYEHGAVMFTDYRLAGDWFAAMDSAVPQDTAFNEAISLMVECEPGEELDRVWEALSADPAAEQCGWCKDRYGVSWQVVPATMDELMSRPGAYGKLMGMKKIDAGEF